MGIDSLLRLNEEGTLIVVKGHVDCAGGESFTVGVTVRQQGSQTSVAHASTAQPCAGEEQSWSAIVESEGSGVFQGGDAEACAVGRVDDLDGATFTRRWCQDVVLVED